jgi:hypothetical protein
VPLPELVRVFGCEVSDSVNCLCCLQAGRNVVANNDVHVRVLVGLVFVGWGLALMLVGHGSEPYGTDSRPVKGLIEERPDHMDAGPS